jgi:hypothetical protein
VTKQLRLLLLLRRRSLSLYPPLSSASQPSALNSSLHSGPSSSNSLPPQPSAHKLNRLGSRRSSSLPLATRQAGSNNTPPPGRDQLMKLPRQLSSRIHKIFKFYIVKLVQPVPTSKLLRTSKISLNSIYATQDADAPQAPARGGFPLPDPSQSYCPARSPRCP